jgi:hypothetical protein
VGNLEGDSVDGLESAEIAVKIVDLEGGHGGGKSEIGKVES